MKKAAQQGNVNAQCCLVATYVQGHDMGSNDNKAREWFEKAAQQGYVNAQYNLGVMYENGLGVTQNQTKTKLWFEKNDITN